MSRLKRVNVPGLLRLPAFSHATIADQHVYVSGMVGSTASEASTPSIVSGGIEPETAQCLANILSILRACECELEDLVKLSVYLTDMTDFPAMNQAYEAFFGEVRPARITVGVNALALGASIEIDAIAFRAM
jgi:2-iminobutanoate/2-iminopropanoate deaminase